MNGVAFYDQLVKRFAREDLNVGLFVDPRLNHTQFPDVQFVSPSGSIVPPVHTHAWDFVYPEPLAGPFYRRPIEGACLSNTNDSGWRRVQLIVRLPDGKLACSCFIGIKSDVMTIKKELESIGIKKWYRIDRSRGDWKYIPDGMV